MLTLLGLAVLGIAGTGTAASFGLVDVEKDFEILGREVHVEFSRENPFQIKVK